MLRATAIIFMVAFHTIFDLNQLMGIDINYQSGFWYWVGKASALTFIFLAGISSGFSKNTVRRGIKVLVFAMVITLITYIFFGEQYIRFGILHLLGTGMILFPMLKRLNNLLLLISAAGIAFAAIPLKNIIADTSLFLPFGVMHQGFDSFDYCPIIPYISIFILGILAYKVYYYKKQSLFKFSYENKVIMIFSKNSLVIYLIHQPIIIAIVYVIKFLKNIQR